MDTSSKRVRLAMSHSLASVLLSLQTDIKHTDLLNDSEVRGTKKKKGNSAAKSEEDHVDSTSPTLQKPAVGLPFSIDFCEILHQLSASYARSSSRYVRSGIILSYGIVLKALGATFANANYATIIQHLLTDIASHPLLGDDKHRALESRRHINYLLGHVVRRQLLDEPAKVMAIRVACEILGKKHSGKGSETEALPMEATVCVLTELAGLLQDLGSAIAVEKVRSSPKFVWVKFHRSYWRIRSPTLRNILRVRYRPWQRGV